MIFISPQLEHAKREIDVVEVYAANCSDFTLDTIYNVMDIFAFAHFWGWGMKVRFTQGFFDDISISRRNSNSVYKADL